MSAAAARCDDSIEHSSALGGLLAGLAIGAGAVLIGIAVVGTGGLGGLAIAAMIGAGAAAGGGIGQLLGSLSFAQRQTGSIKSGSPNVHINSKPAARAHIDYVECTDHSGTPKILAQGSSTVYINGLPAARVGDCTVCDAKISVGSPNVVIGGETETTDEIDPEVPGWLEGTVLGIGLASAVILVGPAMALWGLFGGMVGGAAGYRLGGELWGEGSNGQKLMAFGGSVIVGGLAARYRFQHNGGLGSNFGNVNISKRTPTPLSSPNGRGPTPVRGADGRFIKSGSEPHKYNRKTQYPSDYRAGVREEVLDANTIKSGKHAGKVMTADGEKVYRNDPRLTIEHNKPVVEHWNERGYNSSRAERNDFYNDTSNMSLKLRSANSSEGAKMGTSGIRYRQDVGPEYE